MSYICYLCLQECSCLIYVICVCRSAHVLFMLFVFVGCSCLIYVICVCRSAHVLFMLFVSVGVLMSYLCYLCLQECSCLIYVICVCRSAHVLFMLFVFACTQWCLTHIVFCFCFVFLRLVCPMLPVSLDCTLLIAPSLFSNVQSNKYSESITKSIFVRYRLQLYLKTSMHYYHGR